VPTTIITQWPTGLTKQVTKTYDSGFAFSGGTDIYGKLMSETDSDYGSGGPGATLRRTVYNYQAFVSPNYLTYNTLAESRTTTHSAGAEFSIKCHDLTPTETKGDRRLRQSSFLACCDVRQSPLPFKSRK
jgi:hypothetical protein